MKNKKNYLFKDTVIDSIKRLKDDLHREDKITYTPDYNVTPKNDIESNLEELINEGIIKEYYFDENDQVIVFPLWN